MSSGDLYDAAVGAADAAVVYNAARRRIVDLRHTAKIRELADGTPVIGQAGAHAARDELKAATLALDVAVERYADLRGEMPEQCLT